MIYKKLLFAFSIGILAVNSLKDVPESEIETYEAPKLENILYGLAAKEDPNKVENDWKTKNNAFRKKRSTSNIDIKVADIFKLNINEESKKADRTNLATRQELKSRSLKSYLQKNLRHPKLKPLGRNLEEDLEDDLQSNLKELLRCPNVKKSCGKTLEDLLRCGCGRGLEDDLEFNIKETLRCPSVKNICSKNLDEFLRCGCGKGLESNDFETQIGELLRCPSVKKTCGKNLEELLRCGCSRGLEDDLESNIKELLRCPSVKKTCGKNIEELLRCGCGRGLEDYLESNIKELLRCPSVKKTCGKNIEELLRCGCGRGLEDDLESNIKELLRCPSVKKTCSKNLDELLRCGCDKGLESNDFETQIKELLRCPRVKKTCGKNLDELLRCGCGNGLENNDFETQIKELLRCPSVKKTCGKNFEELLRCGCGRGLEDDLESNIKELLRCPSVKKTCGKNLEELLRCGCGRGLEDDLESNIKELLRCPSVKKTCGKNLEELLRCGCGRGLEDDLESNIKELLRCPSVKKTCGKNLDELLRCGCGKGFESNDFETQIKELLRCPRVKKTCGKNIDELLRCGCGNGLENNDFETQIKELLRCPSVKKTCGKNFEELLRCGCGRGLEDDLESNIKELLRCPSVKKTCGKNLEELLRCGCGRGFEDDVESNIKELLRCPSVKKTCGKNIEELLRCGCGRGLEDDLVSSIRKLLRSSNVKSYGKNLEGLLRCGCGKALDENEESCIKDLLRCSCNKNFENLESKQSINKYIDNLICFIEGSCTADRKQSVPDNFENVQTEIKEGDFTRNRPRESTNLLRQLKSLIRCDDKYKDEEVPAYSVTIKELQDILNNNQNIKSKRRKRDVKDKHKYVGSQSEREDKIHEKYSNLNKNQKHQSSNKIKGSQNYVTFIEQLMNTLSNKYRLSNDVSVELLDLGNLHNANKKSYLHQNRGEDLNERVKLVYTDKLSNSKLVPSDKYRSTSNKKSSHGRHFQNVIKDGRRKRDVKSQHKNIDYQSEYDDNRSQKSSRFNKKQNEKYGIKESRNVLNFEKQIIDTIRDKLSNDVSVEIIDLANLPNGNKNHYPHQNPDEASIDSIDYTNDFGNSKISSLEKYTSTFNEKSNLDRLHLKGLEQDRKQKSYSVGYGHNIQKIIDSLSNSWLDMIDAKGINKLITNSGTMARNNEEEKEVFVQDVMDYIKKNTGQIPSFLNQNQIRYVRKLMKELKEKFDDDELLAQVYDLLFGVPAVKHNPFLRSKKHPTITEQMKKNNRNKRVKIKINSGRSQNGPSITEQLKKDNLLKRVRVEINKLPAKQKRWGLRWVHERRHRSNEGRRNEEENRYGVPFEMTLQGLANLNHA